MYRPTSNLAAEPSDAQKALAAAPGYFMTWYTIKSVGLVAVSCWLAYQLGKARSARNH